ncbi:hypothetical protein Ddc_02995 [Ditylenchus destructor]|nr:hypothetical protein Ddc_02995 [Ditylenchus destructor]
MHFEIENHPKAEKKMPLSNERGIGLVGKREAREEIACLFHGLSSSEAAAVPVLWNWVQSHCPSRTNHQCIVCSVFWAYGTLNVQLLLFGGPPQSQTRPNKCQIDIFQCTKYGYPIPNNTTVKVCECDVMEYFSVKFSTSQEGKWAPESAPENPLQLPKPCSDQTDFGGCHFPSILAVD